LSDEVAVVLVALGHPNRLVILMALEERPRSLGELVGDLGLQNDPVRHALRHLSAAGLIEVVEERETAPNLTSHIYGTTRAGWSTIRDAVTKVAASRRT
jgi:predicted ArsR family transcriptional regulator